MSYFLTGSQVYGTPRDDSDIDLALFADCECLRWIGTFADKSLIESREGHDSFRFGKLNLLLFYDRKEFDSWKIATENLKHRRPVTREQAIQEIDRQLNEEEGRNDALFRQEASANQ